VLSGSVPLNASWTAHRTPAGANVWATDLGAQWPAPAQRPQPPPRAGGKPPSSLPQNQISSLRLNGRRVTRARFPNCNPEIDTFPTGWVPTGPSSSSPSPWEPSPTGGSTLCAGCAFVTTAGGPNGSMAVNGTERQVYTHHMEGVGGPCAIFASGRSYWCAEHPSSACPSSPQQCDTCNGSSGGGSGLPATGQPAAFFGSPPVALTYTAEQLPNAPYADPAGAVLQAWRDGHWFNYIWEVSAYTSTSDGHTAAGHTADGYTSGGGGGAAGGAGAAGRRRPAAGGRIGLGRGGFQGAQQGVLAAQEWFVENVLEELDGPNEFYHELPPTEAGDDAAGGGSGATGGGGDGGGRLLLSYNGTGPPPNNGTLEAPALTTLLRVAGTLAAPVIGLRLAGLAFTGTAPTYLDDTWDTPSGGDWALNWGGAVHAEGTERLAVSGCTFSRLDGTALFLGGANYDAVVQENEFAWLGQNAVVLWGRSDGVDATAGDFPRRVTIEHNLCHEVGHYEKQSSCVFVAKSAETSITGNAFFNGPRAMIVSCTRAAHFKALAVLTSPAHCHDCAHLLYCTAMTLRTHCTSVASSTECQ
jgi:hypothetical protein